MREIYFSVRRGLHVDLRSIQKPEAKLLRELFDYANPDFSKKERMGFFTGNIPRRLQSYDEESHELVLPRGGTDKVRSALDARGLGYWFEDDRLELDPIDFELGESAEPIEPRPYQERVIDAAFEVENCLIRSATGSGKTEAMLEFIRRARQPALVVVWTASLLTQWVDRIRKRWGWPERAIGVWGGGKKRLGNGIMIAMQQSLVKDRDRFANDFGAIICDEVQKFAARTFRDVVSRFPARYRIGVSDDERRKDRMDFMIRDTFGKVAAEVSSDELVDLGYLADVEIVVVPTNFRIEELEKCPPEERAQLSARMQVEIQERLATDAERTDIARRIAGLEARAGRSVLVFCNRTEQAQELARSIVLMDNVPCGLMLGGRENRQVFDDTKARLAEGSLRCAVGSSATYTGEDIPRLSVGVVVTPTGGNKQLFRQQRGRLARKFPGKVRGRLYYLWDPGVFPDHRDNLRRWFGSDMVQVVQPEELERFVG